MPRCGRCRGAGWCPSPSPSPEAICCFFLYVRTRYLSERHQCGSLCPPWWEPVFGDRRRALLKGTVCVQTELSIPQGKAGARCYLRLCCITTSFDAAGTSPRWRSLWLPRQRSESRECSLRHVLLAFMGQGGRVAELGSVSSPVSVLGETGLVRALQEPAWELTSSLKPYQESEGDCPGLLSSGDILLGAFQQAAISGCPLTAAKIKAPGGQHAAAQPDAQSPAEELSSLPPAPCWTQEGERSSGGSSWRLGGCSEPR